MSLAGFDPRRAIDFWEDRLNDAWALDADAVRTSGALPTASFWSPHGHSSGGESGAAGSAGSDGSTHGSHPLGSERVRRLKKVLDQWDEERAKFRATAAAQESSETALVDA
jgi:hypothetical protein